MVFKTSFDRFVLQFLLEISHFYSRNHHHDDRLIIIITRRLLLSEGYEPDIIYTSRLKRAVKSTWSILNTLNTPYLPVYKSWRLNERHYGALTGLKKMDAAKELGVEVVQAWRNSLKARPPPMKAHDEHYPGKDRRYEDLAEEQIPLTESLMDCMERGENVYDVLNLLISRDI